MLDYIQDMGKHKKIRKFTLEEMNKNSAEIKQHQEQHPDKIAILVEPTEKTNLEIPEDFKKKFLVKKDMQASQFTWEVRKRLVLKPEEALFIFCNNTSISGSNNMNEIYEKHKDEDGFLRLTISAEHAFG